ncbi:YebC/PmpR family DNA-binding transcriptional regulator [Legionella sp. W05-934-2]|uniref:YebC/PmpR family DNA-binding transcriptional regulator n=1 Tax=Legionella sp. W05-934-2 TaxID=1198649 RepID=UPI00346335DF
MAGHSKWANIRFRKGAQDAKRGKIFTKLIREITVAARMGGEDETTNPRLRDAISKALKQNMKRDTIENAIKRGAGGLEGENMMELRYEGYGPQGVAIIVDCLTDNKNRTVSEVRHAFTKFGGNLGTDGSVAYMFTNQGEISLEPINDEEKAMEVAIEAGAEDVYVENGFVEIITSEDNYHQMLASLEENNLIVANNTLTMRAQTEVALDGEAAETFAKLYDMLEDLDDVQKIYSNAVLPDSMYE